MDTNEPSRSGSITSTHVHVHGEDFGFVRTGIVLSTYEYAVKRKMLISCVATTRLICGFGFVYAKSWFSHNATQIRKKIV